MPEIANRPTDSPSNEDAPAYRLSFDLLELVAKQLVARDWHRTCANLATTSKAVRDQIDPTLWKSVVYRWNNEATKTDTDALGWKDVFLSDGAKYIQFLTVIPASKPDVRLDLDSADFPWLDALLSGPNRLKACIVTGKDEMLGLYLLKYYTPCGIGMWSVLELAAAARALSKSTYMGALVHPYAKMPTSSREATIEITGDIKSLLVEGARHVPAMEELQRLNIRPFIGIGLVLPPSGLPPYYLKALVAEMLALICPTARWYMERNFEERPMQLSDVRLFILVVTSTEAMIAGEVVNIAYGLDPAFAAIAFQVRTREALTKQQLRRYTDIMEKSFIATHRHFRSKPHGGAYIMDGNAETWIDTPVSGFIGINASPNFVGNQGSLQYWSTDPDTCQVVRPILMSDRSESDLGVIEVPRA